MAARRFAVCFSERSQCGRPPRVSALLRPFSACSARSLARSSAAIVLRMLATLPVSRAKPTRRMPARGKRNRCTHHAGSACGQRRRLVLKLIEVVGHAEQDSTAAPLVTVPAGAAHGSPISELHCDHCGQGRWKALSYSSSVISLARKSVPSSLAKIMPLRSARRRSCSQPGAASCASRS